MSWFRHLDQIAEVAPSSVGYSAYCLGKLKQDGLPVPEGWVLSQDIWQNVLAQMVKVLPHQTPNLSVPSSEPGLKLQSLSRCWQTALKSALEEFPPSFEGRNIEHWACPFSHWVLYPSLLLANGDMPTDQVVSLHRALQPGVGIGASILPSLYEFWEQAFKTRSLMVWGQYCQDLFQVRLAGLLLPLYPAQASGRLILAGDTAYIEAVEGLIFSLIRGEAIPARCQVDVDGLNPITWQPGHQERLCRLGPQFLDGGEASVNLEHAVGAPALLGTDRLSEELVGPLSNDQVVNLVNLAVRVRAVLTSLDRQPDTDERRHDEAGHGPHQHGVEIEWVLHPSTEKNEFTLSITQAMPCLGQAADGPKASGKLPTPASLERPSLSPPPLPQVSLVVKGIGASSGRAQAPAVVARSPQDLPDPLPQGCIVVMPDLQPDRFLQLESVAGIVTEEGGATCHAAILAREMGIPAVVGAPQATQLIDSSLLLWLDGERGLVYGIGEENSASLLNAPGDQPSAERETVGPSQVSQQPSAPEPQFFPSLRTKVMVNLSQSRRVKDLPMPQIDGVGLLRSEWLMLEILDQRHPWHWVHQGQEAELQTRLAQTLEPILQALGDKPLRYRSLDLRSHEWQTLEGSPAADANPMLGLRGALSYGIDSRLFEVELGALAALQRAGYHNLQLMLPFVRSVEEVITCRRYINAAGLSEDEGFALWIMAEVPSVLFLLPAYAKTGVQGIAIGSNDLTQLLLAVDRDQRTMASSYDERHPVVQMALAYLIREARRCGMVCSICGQAPVRYPELIADLVAWGIDSISVEMGALSFTREAVWQAEQR